MQEHLTEVFHQNYVLFYWSINLPNLYWVLSQTNLSNIFLWESKCHIGLAVALHTPSPGMCVSDTQGPGWGVTQTKYLAVGEKLYPHPPSTTVLPFLSVIAEAHGWEVGEDGWHATRWFLVGVLFPTSAQSCCRPAPNFQLSSLNIPLSPLSIAI